MAHLEYENIQTTSLRTPPTYLKELGIEDQDILLVHLKSDPLKEALMSPTQTDIVKKKKKDSLDLTGSPLKVDLSGDVTLLSQGNIQNFNLWAEQEETHFPMELKRARQFINQQLRMKKCEGESCNPIYVISDGDNAESTVILGAQKASNFLMSTKVNILGYLLKDHESLSLDQMVNRHTLNTRTKDCKINYTTKFRYYLYGTFLQKMSNLYDLEIYGSICIETICKDKCSIDSPQNLLNTKNMILQIIVGHPLSSVSFLWKDLCLLQTFLNILSSSDSYNNPETLLSEEPLEVSNIYKEISSAIGFNFLKKGTKMNFSLSHIRVDNILDKLWNILKHCDNLADLRESFHYLFEELTEVETNLKLSDKDGSNLATIIDGILKGNLAVPTITFSQALEFLFELGTEKLKNDYQTIIKNFCPSSESVIAAKWSQLKKTLSLQDGYRKTRITVMQKPGKTDLNHNVFKLAYLAKMHTTVEFIYLVKTETGFPEETFDFFCERLFKTYIEKDTETKSDFVDLFNTQICNFEIVTDVPEKELKKNDLPSTWTMEMTSLINDMEITTLYHLCGKPIFPMTIYNNYDTSDIANDDSVRFFVTQLERYKNLL